MRQMMVQAVLAGLFAAQMAGAPALAQETQPAQAPANRARPGARTASLAAG